MSTNKGVTLTEGKKKTNAVSLVKPCSVKITSLHPNILFSKTVKHNPNGAPLQGVYKLRRTQGGQQHLSVEKDDSEDSSVCSLSDCDDDSDCITILI